MNYILDELLMRLKIVCEICPNSKVDSISRSVKTKPNVLCVPLCLDDHGLDIP